MSLDDVKVTHQHAPRPPPIELGINVEKPKFPQYAVCSKRLESFALWPEYLPVKKEDMAEAGLVYTGVGDSVRCYFCGGGLRNWESGDVPMEEHGKWYPQCPHILLVKGQAYIERLARGEKPEMDGPDGISSKQAYVDTSNSIKTVAAQSCIEMGYSREMVDRAIKIFISKSGNCDFKGTDLCEILFDIEDNSEKQEISINEGDASSENIEDDSQEVADEDQLEPLETLLEENHRLKENQMCKICLDSRADVIFLPCGHMVSCPQCAPALLKCPVCRQTVNGQMKAFFSVINTKT
ncbi:baculoviral IAP repeat-containing protein 7-A-like [Mercenaria mercenaria]|uniref:baculoviral IAP repeat-containing protein 7-A-like n=1 Tax=Mercenaria mercenaria TaxID=6596 RepID=UPI001E1E1482|nr:baculoviral IAP repeat-containing protein 7-A-like [Mercenaria mercenaria]XP_045195467.1 baculoviral IAP repeat-containing protein 7-A-like [Mercenaria mercenaria]